MGAVTFDLSDLEKSMSKSLRFRRLIYYKGAELGHAVLLLITEFNF